MAFLFRGNENHDHLLEILGDRINIKTKNKVLVWIVENIAHIMKERDDYFQKVNRLEKELSEIKSAIKSKLEADQRLATYFNQN